MLPVGLAAGSLVVTGGALAVAPAALAAPAPAVVVVGDATTSPDGTIAIGVDVDADGQLVYSVTKDGEELVSESALGLNLVGGEILGDDAAITSASAQTTTDETWETYVGRDAEVRNHYTERTYAVTDNGYAFSVIARAYDDGVAFRYDVPNQTGLADLEIIDEVTQFNLTGNPDAWWTPQNFDDDEALWQQSTYATMGSSNAPATFRYANGDHLSIHEADLDDYSAMTLKKEPTGLRVELVPSMTRDAAVVRTGAGRDEPTPWRSLTIADNAGGLADSYLLENLNPAPDATLFADAQDWVKGATYVGIWWMLQQDLASWEEGDHHGATTERLKEYIDFAAANGIQGVLAEGWNKGWDGHWSDQDFDAPTDDLDIDEVLSYAESKGVEFIAHNETGSNPWGYETQINDGLFEQYKDWGIHYLKTGYVGSTPSIPSREDADAVYPGSTGDLTPKHHRYDQEMVNHFRFVLTEAAKNQINVNCHECVHGTGEIRTFPNAISREAMRGQEWDAFSGVGNTPEHQLILPFTRGLAAPMDYTPGVMDVAYNNRQPGNWRVKTTAAKQLAMTVNYFSGVQMAADMIEHYSINRGIEWYDGLPAQWDESHTLSADIGDHLVTARRKGTQWWIGAMNADQPRDLSFPLSFLGTGQWVAEIFADTAATDYDADPSSLDVTRVRVTSADTMVAQLGKSSGQAIRIRPATASDASLPSYGQPALTVQSLSAPASAERGDIVPVVATIVNNSPLTARKSFQVSVNGRPGVAQEVVLEPGGSTTLRYSVRIVGNDPVSVSVGGVTVNVAVTATVPVPQNVRLVSVTSTSVNIAWDPVPGASYEIYRRADVGVYPATPLASLPVGTTTWTDAKRANGNNYVIRAVLNGARSAASSEVSQFGTLVGTLSDPTGDDNGPGTYEYPKNGVYAPGSFDLTGVRVYDTGNGLTFVTAINAPIDNPWGCDTICLQHVEIYLGSGDGSAVPARAGTNLSASSPWSRAVVIDGRWNGGVYSAPGSAKVGDVSLSKLATRGEIAASISKSALPAGFNIGQARIGVGMFINIETPDAINNIRPVLNWDDPGNTDGWIPDWRPGGGLGYADFGSAAKDSDTRDGNALDIIVDESTQSQADLLNWTAHSPVILPLVALQPPAAETVAELIRNGGATEVVEQTPAANPQQGVTALTASGDRVPGLAVSFTLTGSATFAAGGQVAVVTTGADGKADVPAIRTSTALGTVKLSATAGDISQALADITVVPARVTVAKPSFSKRSQTYGHSSVATVTADVSGAIQGVVTFRNGGQVLGSAQLVRQGSSYRASIKLPRTLAAGVYKQVTASLALPDRPGATSVPAVTFTVVKARPGKVTVSAKRYKRSAKPVVTVKVAKLNNGAPAIGSVAISVGKKRVKTVSLPKGGTVKVKLAKKFSAKKSLKVRAVFLPKDARNVASKTSKSVTAKRR
ncbi:hypothetical protein GCM10010401_02060 [Rarobacter faecitabidus]